MFIVAHCRGTRRRRCRQDQVPRAYDMFHDDARQINATHYEKTRRLGKKLKTAFNSSSKLHIGLHILDPAFFWLSCTVIQSDEYVLARIGNKGCCWIVEEVPCFHPV